MAREVGKGRYKKAKESRTVDISQTQWKKGMGGPKGEAGRLVGPKGQLFTGTVKMQDGSKVVYEKGKRVSRATTAGGGVTTKQADKKFKRVEEKKTDQKDKSLETSKAKDGTVRMGAKGRGLRKYNAKTGRWEKVSYGSVNPGKKATSPKINKDAQKPAPIGAKEPASNKKYGRPAMAQPTSPRGQLQRVRRALAFQNQLKRGLEAKKIKTQKEKAELKKINSEIERLKKALGS